MSFTSPAWKENFKIQIGHRACVFLIFTPLLRDGAKEWLPTLFCNPTLCTKEFYRLGILYTQLLKL